MYYWSKKFCSMHIYHWQIACIYVLNKMMHRYGGFQNFKTYKVKLYSKTISIMAWSKYRTICDIGLVIKDQIIKKKALKDKKSVFVFSI